MNKQLSHRILVISQHYWPEPFPSQAICEALCQRGYTVHVITDIPNYPHGNIYAGYENGKNRQECRNGVEIERVFTVPRKTGVFRRVLNYYSYAASSCLKVMTLNRDYDLVLICQSSPVMMAYAGILYAKLHRKKSLLYCMDLWPVCLKAAGIHEGSLLYRRYHRLSGRVYRSADRILTASPGFMNYMNREFGVGYEKMDFLPQISVCEHTDEYTAEKQNVMKAVFIGNIGQAQCLDVLLHAASLIERMGITDHGKPIMFQVIGGGTCFPVIQKLKETLGSNNVALYGSMEPERAAVILQQADCALLTFTKDPDIAMTLPAKIQMYLSAGKPVIASADGEVMRLIRQEQCGICVPAEDPKELAYALIRYLTSARSQYAARAAQTYQRRFSRNVIIDRLEKEMSDLWKS